MSLRPFLPLVALLLACGLRVIDHRGSQATAPEPDAAPAPVDAQAMAAVDAIAARSPDAGPPPDGASPPADVATTEPSGAGVTIDGRFVPRAKAIVILHLGHSNRAGRATGPAELMPYFYDVDPQLFTYAKGGVFRPAKEPTAPDNEMGQAAGPGMALLRSAKAVAPPDAVIISIGHGHSGSFQGYCSSFRKNGLFYDLIMAPAQELRGKVTFAGIFTMLGQSEHNAPPAQQAMFAQCLTGLAAEMRADLGEPTLPFMVGDYEMGISRADIAPTSAFAKPIIAQIQQVPGMVSTCTVIPTLGCAMQDDHHFNMAGHKMWAASAIQLLLDHHWAPWATAP
jgi:hypothetical protein